MNAIVSCAQDWIKSGLPNSDKIQQGVDHNARLAESMAQSQHAQLSSLNQKYNLGFDDLTDLFSIDDKEEYDKKFHGFPPGSI